MRSDLCPNPSPEQQHFTYHCSIQRTTTLTAQTSQRGPPPTHVLSMPSPTLRIASFLPAATEMVFQLGLGGCLVGRTHECDSPAEAKDAPVLVDCVLNLEGKTTQEIDDLVSARLREGKSLYHVDEERLREAAPSLLITQNLCQVCTEVV